MSGSITLNRETFGQGESLSLIHGWGAQNAVWREWAHSHLAPHFTVTLIELPGFGDSPKIELPKDSINATDKAARLNQAWLSALMDALPPKTHLLGWSLGGLMAQQLALQAPERVTKLICLATTPRFVQTEGWKWAVTPELMADFIKALGLDSWALLSRFWKLQLQGSDGARQLIKHLTTQMQGRKIPSFSALVQGLELLRDIDMRDHLQTLTQPTLWLLGEKDPLIPHDLAAQLAVLQPQAQVKIVAGGAHVPFMSHPEQCAQIIKDFLLNDSTV